MKLLFICLAALFSVCAAAQGKFHPDSIKAINYRHGLNPNPTDIQNYYGTDYILTDTFKDTAKNVFEFYYAKHGISFLFKTKDSTLQCFKVYLDSFPYKISGYNNTLYKNITLKEVSESYNDPLYLEYDAPGKTITVDYEFTSWVIKTSLGKQKSFYYSYTQSSDIYLMLEKLYSKKPNYVYIWRHSSLAFTDE